MTVHRLPIEDNRILTPELMMELSLEDMKSGDITANKGVLILLDDREDYDHVYRMSNIKTSEAVALLEAAKHHLVRHLNGEIE